MLSVNWLPVLCRDWRMAWPMSSGIWGTTAFPRVVDAFERRQNLPAITEDKASAPDDFLAHLSRPPDELGGAVSCRVEQIPAAVVLAGERRVRYPLDPANAHNLAQ